MNRRKLHVELEVPGNMICKNTIEGMQSGLVYGHMGLAEYIVEHEEELVKLHRKDYDAIKVSATGGLAPMVEDGVKCIDVIERLTLDG